MTYYIYMLFRQIEPLVKFYTKNDPELYRDRNKVKASFVHLRLECLLVILPSQVNLVDQNLAHEVITVGEIVQRSAAVTVS